MPSRGSVPKTDSKNAVLLLFEIVNALKMILITTYSSHALQTQSTMVYLEGAGIFILDAGVLPGPTLLPSPLQDGLERFGLTSSGWSSDVQPPGAMTMWTLFFFKCGPCSSSNLLLQVHYEEGALLLAG